jgi:hypothetical protein
MGVESSQIRAEEDKSGECHMNCRLIHIFCLGSINPLEEANVARIITMNLKV